MSSLTLHPFGSGPVRNRNLAPAPAPSAAKSLFADLADRYWAGWAHYARAYAADLDQRPRFPLPTTAPASTETASRPAEEPAVAAQVPPVVRVWRGRVHTEQADAFHAYLQAQGAPSYRRAPGNLGVWVLRRPLGAVTEYMLISHWTDAAAVAAYAGGDASKPLHYAETERYLLPEGEGVEHFALLPEAAPRYASIRI